MSALPYLAHGATLTLAWFTLVNIALSLIVAVIAMGLVRSRAIEQASLWLAIRLLPAVGAIAFVAIVFVPSYWRYEPREMVEGFDLSLTLVAAAGMVIAAAALARGIIAARRANARVERWMRGAREVASSSGELPMYEVDADQPVIALSGVFRQRLLVTRGLVDALSPAELAASVAHEVGHLRALDNLKRLVMHASPDILIAFPAARALEQRWASAAEHAADRMAGSGEAVRCALASALVKVARLTPSVPPSTEPISTLIAGGEIASRVQRLLDDGQVSDGRGRSLPMWIAACAVLTVPVFLAYTPLLRAVHEATEILVRTLP
jgi:Zn-dependent protease with chaperone function